MYIQAHILVFLLLSDCGTAWFSGSGGRCGEAVVLGTPCVGQPQCTSILLRVCEKTPVFPYLQTLSDALLNCCIVAAEYYMRFIIYDLC